MILTNQQILIDENAELEARLDLNCWADAGIALHQRIARIEDGGNSARYGFLTWTAVITAGRMTGSALRCCGKDRAQERRAEEASAVIRILILESRIARPVDGLLLWQRQRCSIWQDDAIELHADALIAKALGIS